MIRAENIACMRGGRETFSGISFELTPGESLLLRGPNGVGKSRLLRLVAGLLTPSRGMIETSAPLALADERQALDPASRLEEALAYWNDIDHVPPAVREKTMQSFALLPLRDIPVHMLSTGQRKRAVLARTFASSARLILLDEPGNGLDGASLDMLGKAMAAHLSDGGAIIAASHFDLPHNFTHVLDMQEYQS